MLIRSSESLVEVLCPAKLNLCLEVKGKRPDGYHEIETVMQTVSLYDRLVIEPSARGTELMCDDPTVPRGEENSICRAVKLMRRATGNDGGVRIRLEKRIPAGAGLAGGSSDAAGAIVALNLLWKTGLQQTRLAEIGAAVGSDVPFFFSAGAAVCRGRGEKVSRLPASGPYQFVVVWPGFQIATRDVYRELGFILTDSADNGRINRLVERLGRSQAEEVSECFFNRLEETAVKLRNELTDVRQAMAEEGLLGVTMTGSGSAYFGLCERKEVAEHKKENLAASGIGFAFACESTQD